MNTFDFRDYIKNNTTENIIEIRTEQQISDNYDNYDLLKTNIINRITRLIPSSENILSDSYPIRIRIPSVTRKRLIPTDSTVPKEIILSKKRAWAQFSNSRKNKNSRKK